MIDRPSRTRLAFALRRYAARRSTNDDLAAVEVDWRDRGAVAVADAAWGLYSDHGRHRATGRHALSRETRHAVARWIVFLQSDQEYVWPEYRFEAASTLLAVLTLGWSRRRARRRFDAYREAGEYEVWPFISRQAELEARSRPRLLASRTSSGGDCYAGQ